MKPTFIALLALCLCLPVTGADKKKPGTVLWEFETGGAAVNSSPAIKTDSKGLAQSPWPMRGQNA